MKYRSEKEDFLLFLFDQLEFGTTDDFLCRTELNCHSRFQVRLMADTEVEQVDYEGEEENVVGDHPMETEDALPAPRLRSVVVGGDTSGTKKKGRGFRDAMDVDREDRGGQFESLDTEGGQGPQRCIRFFHIVLNAVLSGCQIHNCTVLLI